MSISATVQYFTAKNIQAHSAYSSGIVTNLYTQVVYLKTVNSTAYYVQYTFSPIKSNKKYYATYGVTKKYYDTLSRGSVVSVYYYTPNPNVQNIAGYQSSLKNLELVASVSIIILVLSSAALLYYK